jgi:hypothetical protein
MPEESTRRTVCLQAVTSLHSLEDEIHVFITCVHHTRSNAISMIESIR